MREMNEAILDLIRNKLPKDAADTGYTEALVWRFYQSFQEELPQLNPMTKLRFVPGHIITMVEIEGTQWDFTYPYPKSGLKAKFARLFCVGRGKLWHIGYYLGPPPIDKRRRTIELKHWGAQYSNSLVFGMRETTQFFSLIMAYDGATDTLFVRQ